MKKILMAAVAVSVMSAGAVSAATISTSTTIGMTGSVPSYAGGTSILRTGGGYEPYTIANEVNNIDANSAVKSKIVISPSSATAIAAGTYLITYNVTGGTFDNAVSSTSNLVLTTSVDGGSATVNSVSVNSTGTYSFIVTVASGYLTSMALQVPIRLGLTKATVAVGGSIVSAVGAVDVDGGDIAPVTIVDYRDGLTFSATPVNHVLTLASSYMYFADSGFFPSYGKPIGSSVGFGVTAGAAVSDTPFKDFISGPLTTASITAAKLVVAGDLAAFDARIAAANGYSYAQAPDSALAPGTFLAASANNLTSLKAKTATIVLKPKAPDKSGNASAYTLAAPVVTLASGLTALEFNTLDLGLVSLEGNQFYAAWVGDGSNGINYSVRIGNRTTAAISDVLVTLLNSTNTVTAQATCNLGTLAASGELVINSARLQTCFGAFGRGDFRFTVNTLDSGVTAKMRSVSAGVVNEISLGGGTYSAQKD